MEPGLLDVYPEGMVERPDHGSEALIQLFAAAIPASGPHAGKGVVLSIAAHNVRHADIALMQQFAMQPEHLLRQLIACNSLANAICNKCLDKSDLLKLKLCDHCCLTWYCSKECQAADRAEHTKRCCKPDGPLDIGPM